MEPRRKGARAATPGGIAPSQSGATAPATSRTDALEHIEAVINAGGQILLGTIAPLPGAAVAHGGNKTLAMLRRRPNESAASLLRRLDAAIATVQKTGSRVDGRPDPDWPDPMPALREDRATLAAALGGVATFTYLYDFGDGWEHKIKVEKVLAPDPQLARPLCIVGVNACPPEDVGGPPGYVEFLQAIRNPNHEEHAAMLEWCGGGFDPTAFDIDAVHERLAEIKL